MAGTSSAKTRFALLPGHDSEMAPGAITRGFAEVSINPA
jgi:hypothetical protein